jgi:hypothetical protein
LFERWASFDNQGNEDGSLVDFIEEDNPHSCPIVLKSEDCPTVKPIFKHSEIAYFQIPQGAIVEIDDPYYYNQSTSSFEDKIVTISNGEYEIFLNENYTISASYIGQVSQSDIYVFDHWSGSNVDFGGGATSTTSRETDVVFKSAGATVTAVYVSANANDIAVTINQNETLTIPAGGHYVSQFNSGNYTHFGFYVFGTLEINGESDAPVIFESTVDYGWEGIKLRPKDNASHVQVNHCVFRNALETINIVEDEGTVVIEMDNCLITNCGTSIYHHAFYEGIIPTIVMYIDNCTFI